MLRGDGPSRCGSRSALLVEMCTIIGLLVLPWYLYKFFDFQAGGDSNNTALLLTDFHQGRDLLAKDGSRRQP